MLFNIFLAKRLLFIIENQGSNWPSHGSHGVSSCVLLPPFKGAVPFRGGAARSTRPHAGRCTRSPGSIGSDLSGADLDLICFFLPRI
jgi:hypothetical protein